MVRTTDPRRLTVSSKGRGPLGLMAVADPAQCPMDGGKSFVLYVSQGHVFSGTREAFLGALHVGVRGAHASTFEPCCVAAPFRGMVSCRRAPYTTGDAAVFGVRRPRERRPVEYFLTSRDESRGCAATLIIQ